MTQYAVDIYLKLYIGSIWLSRLGTPKFSSQMFSFKESIC